MPRSDVLVLLKYDTYFCTVGNNIYKSDENMFVSFDISLSRMIHPLDNILHLSRIPNNKPSVAYKNGLLLEYYFNKYFWYLRYPGSHHDGFLWCFGFQSSTGISTWSSLSMRLHFVLFQELHLKCFEI